MLLCGGPGAGPRPRSWGRRRDCCCRCLATPPADTPNTLASTVPTQHCYTSTVGERCRAPLAPAAEGGSPAGAAAPQGGRALLKTRATAVRYQDFLAHLPSPQPATWPRDPIHDPRSTTSRRSRAQPHASWAASRKHRRQRRRYRYRSVGHRLQRHLVQVRVRLPDLGRGPELTSSRLPHRVRHLGCGNHVLGPFSFAQQYRRMLENRRVDRERDRFAR